MVFDAALPVRYEFRAIACWAVGKLFPRRKSRKVMARLRTWLVFSRPEKWPARRQKLGHRGIDEDLSAGVLPKKRLDEQIEISSCKEMALDGARTCRVDVAFFVADQKASARIDLISMQEGQLSCLGSVCVAHSRADIV
jgi:hypothetical protein